MMDKWNNGVKSIKMSVMCLLFHHSSVLQHSTTLLLCESKKRLEQQRHRKINTLLYLIKEM